MKFLKQLSLYTLVGVISAGINFFVMPVLSHYLSPADYGMLSLFNTYVTILIPIISVSAYSLLNVEFFREKNKDIYSSKFTSIQIIPLINTTVLALLTWNFYGRFIDDLELGGTGIQWGYIILAITLLSIYYEQFIQFIILQKKATAFTYYSLFRVGIEVGLTFYFIIDKGWNWEGRIYSWLISSLLFFCIGFIYFYREGLLKGPIKLSYITEGIKFGGPLVLHGIGKFVINQSDRLFIIKMVSMSEAGIYNIGYTVGTLVMLIINAFFNFYTPYLMERLSNITKEGRLQIVKMSYYYVFGCLGLLFIILVFTPVLFTYFIDHRYIEGAKYVFWVALGYCFWGGYMLFSGFIFYLKKNFVLGWLAVFNVASNLLFNYYFIKVFGAIGAAYATALSFFLLMVWIMIIAQKLFPMPWTNIKESHAVSLS